MPASLRALLGQVDGERCRFPGCAQVHASPSCNANAAQGMCRWGTRRSTQATTATSIESSVEHGSSSGPALSVDDAHESEMGTLMASEGGGSQ